MLFSKKNIVALHNISFTKKNVFEFKKELAKKRLNIQNQLGIALLETPPCATSI